MAEIKGGDSSHGRDRGDSTSNGHVYVFEDFELHSETCELFRAGRPAGLQLKPTRLLLYLIEHRQRTVPKEELLEAIWPGGYVGETAFTTAVGEVRRTLSDHGDAQRLIRTFRGRGYRFVGAVARHPIESTPEDAETAEAGRPLAEPNRRRKARRVRPGFAVAGGLALLLLIPTVVSWYRASEAPPDAVQDSWNRIESTRMERIRATMSPRRLASEERDWVLIAQFENLTGEAVFDGMLESAIERELSNSRIVAVIPRPRIEDTLRLMKKPPDTPVGATLGREVCLRDGDIRLLLTGRVEKLDHTYLLSAALVNPVDDVTVASFSEEAEGQKAVVAAVRRLANQIPETLGEKLIAIQKSEQKLANHVPKTMGEKLIAMQEREQKLAKVTTPSLRALQLYSRADAIKQWGLQAPAEELLKQALAEDPEFASAFIQLAHVIGNQGRAKEEYLAYAERAWKLVDTVSERERYYIEGGYYGLRGEHEKAIASYKALLRVDPDHYWATNDLAWEYWPFPETTAYVVRLAELRPRSFDANVLAAQVLVLWGDRRAAAEPYLQRARALLSPWAENRSPRYVAWLQLFPAHEHWLQGEVEEALSVVSRVAEYAKARTGPWRDGFAFWVAGTYLTLGKLRAAEEIFLSYPDNRDPHRQNLLSWTDRARGDEPAVMEHLRRAPPSAYKALHLARAGRLHEAEQVRQAWLGTALSRDYPVCEAAHDKTVRAELALARGQTAEAVRLLEDGVGALRLPRNLCPAAGSRVLARALEQQGEWQMALRVLEEAAQEKKAVYSIYLSGFLGLVWLEIQWQRAELLRKHGREPAAREIEAELRKLLAYADTDHKILRALRELSQQEEVELAKSAE